MVNFKIEHPGAVGVVTIHGTLTANNLHELKDAVMKAFTCAEHVIFNLRQVTEIDGSCFQILCCAHQASTQLNKHITLSCLPHESFTWKIRDARHEHSTDCVMDRTRTCLWLQDEPDAGDHCGIRHDTGRNDDQME